MYFNKIYSTSNVTTSVNIPEVFGVSHLTTETNTLIMGEDFEIKPDVYGIHSIIEFKSIPYIDYSKYDYNRRRWYEVDKYTNLWRHYQLGDYIIEEDAIYTDGGTDKYFSMYNTLKSVADSFHDEQAEYNEYIVPLRIVPYNPITLSIDGKSITDITDYSFNVQPTLNTVAPDKNMQFYFDKKNRLYTNVDFSFYELDTNPKNLSLELYSTISSINVACYMNTNSSNYSNYTPVVDYYILKLTGQTL